MDQDWYNYYYGGGAYQQRAPAGQAGDQAVDPYAATGAPAGQEVYQQAYPGTLGAAYTGSYGAQQTYDALPEQGRQTRPDYQVQQPAAQVVQPAAPSAAPIKAYTYKSELDIKSHQKFVTTVRILMIGTLLVVIGILIWLIIGRYLPSKHHGATTTEMDSLGGNGPHGFPPAPKPSLESSTLGTEATVTEGTTEETAGTEETRRAEGTRATARTETSKETKETQETTIVTTRATTTTTSEPTEPPDTWSPDPVLDRTESGVDIRCGPFYFTYCRRPTYQYYYDRVFNECRSSTNADEPSDVCNHSPNRFATMDGCLRSCVTRKVPFERCSREAMFATCTADFVRETYWSYQRGRCQEWHFRRGLCPLPNAIYAFLSLQECERNCTGGRTCSEPAQEYCSPEQIKFPYFAFQREDGSFQCMLAEISALLGHNCVIGANQFVSSGDCLRVCKQTTAHDLI